MKNFQWYLIICTLLLSNLTSYSQTENEFSAEIEFNNTFKNAFESKNIDLSISSLSKAKYLIEKAAEHPKTKESPKTLFLKGEIYFYAYLIKETVPTAFPEITSNSISSSLKYWKNAYTNSDKLDVEIQNSIKEKKSILEFKAMEYYNSKEYNKAMMAFDNNAQLSTVINKIDTSSIYYAGVCAENGYDWSNAFKFYKKCADFKYKTPEIHKSIAFVLIQDGKTNESIKYLEDIVKNSPKDKNLHLIIGTFYMESGNDDAATNSLKKAIAIDPKFWDAQYQLGAHLLNIGSKKRNEANALKLNDPNFDKMIAESDEFYKQAIIPLEIYLSEFPNDKPVLNCLHQIYRALKNTEKALEYKKRIDAAE